VVKLKLTAGPLLWTPWNDELPPVLQTDDNICWEVEEILEVKVCYSSLWYMVQWKGYSPEHNK
jgi:hypothetical protein